MTLLAASPLVTAAWIGMAALSLAIILCFIRLTIGPSLADRVVALDLIAVLLVGLLVLLTTLQSEGESLRVATVLALINFLGTIGFAVYIRRKAAP